MEVNSYVFMLMVIFKLMAFGILLDFLSPRIEPRSSQ